MPSRRQRQKQLGLSARSRGGYRAGAGRPKGRSDHYVPHVPRPSLSRHHAVHVTMRVHKRAPRLKVDRGPEIVENVFRAERARLGFRLIHYSIRQDHIHLICEAQDRRMLSRGIQRVASRVARGINRLWSRRGRVFADRFHARTVKTPRDARNVVAYVLLNEHRDTAHRGAKLIGLDSASSGLYFDGWADVKPRPPPLDEWPCASPQTWLLRRGWRRQGLIRTDEKTFRT